MAPMQIEIVSGEAALAARAADIICGAAHTKPDALIGLPTGNTPLATYAELTRRAASGACDVRAATVYAIDEFAGATRATPGTNSVFYRQHLRVPFRAVHIPNPGAGDPGEHIRAFADAIRRAGGLDLCVLGIGVNGHIAFNEPGSAAAAPARVVELTAASREAHAEAFGALANVPAHGLTLGVADLLAAKAILVMAQGGGKASMVRAAIEGPQTADVPSSWLQRHHDVTWLLDEAAAGQLSRR